MKKDRIFSIDLIRVVAMLFVIFLHTALNFTVRPDFFATPIWFLLEPIAAVAKTGVLLFFFISGYLVIHKQRSLSENMQRFWRRLLFPLLFFEALRLIYNWYVSPASNVGTFFLREIERLASFPSSPLWFLELLAFFYVLNPVWQVIFASNHQSLARYVVKISLTYSLVTAALMYLFPSFPLMFNTFTAWLGYLFFYLYGGLVRQGWVRKRSWKFYGLLFTFGLGLTIIGDFWASAIRAGGGEILFSQYTIDYLSVPVVATALAIFHLLLNYKYEQWFNSLAGKWVMKLVLWLASLSFGIYLTHIYVVGMLTDIVGFNFNTAGLNVYVFNVLNISIVLGVSIVLTWGIKQVPRLRMIIGEK